MTEQILEISRRDEYAEATRRALMAAGLRAFSEIGYERSGIETISRAARVTRGAFYHHFHDKKDLFDALVVTMQQDAAKKVEAAAKTRDDVWDRLYDGIDAYLDACREVHYARIVIQQGPAVLGAERFAEIEEAYPMALLAATLTALKRRGELRFANVELLSRLVDAMICKIALLMPSSGNPAKLKQDGRALIRGLLGALRVSL